MFNKLNIYKYVCIVFVSSTHILDSLAYELFDSTAVFELAI